MYTCRWTQKFVNKIFSWLSGYKKKIIQKMNRHTFVFFLLYVCKLHNICELKKLHATFTLLTSNNYITLL